MMTKERLAELLGLDNISNIEQKEDDEFEVFDVNFKNINEEFWKQELNVLFWRCNFDIKINLMFKIVEPKIIFSDCVFNEVIFARSTVFKQKIGFLTSIFKNEVYFYGSKPTVFESSVGFSNCIFEKRARFNKIVCKNQIIFDFSIFKDLTYFTDAHFIKASFKKTRFENQSLWDNARFQEAVTFDNTYFQDRANFRISKFCKSVEFKENVFNTVDFSFTDFEDRVLFSSVVFNVLATFYSTFFSNSISFEKSIFDAITVFDNIQTQQTHITFYECMFSKQIKIDKKFLNYDPETILQSNNPSTLRDLFQRFKSNYLTSHNLIEASDFRTQEFYAREAELEKQEKKTWGEEVERWQLWFYRITSDHHTNLAKIFNNVILLIALFGVFSFFLSFCPEVELTNYKNLEVFLSIFAIFAIGGVLFCYLHLLQHLNASKIIILYLLGCLFIFYILLNNIFPHIKDNVSLVLYCFGSCCICCSFIGSYLILIYIPKKNRALIHIISYAICLGLLIIKPKLFFPLNVGDFKDKKLVMQSLGVVYSLLMILMLFSLQKTARKNSIIPS